MSLTIVAIPKQDDYVWNISSEKVPHMTILFLGDDVSDSNTNHIVEFVQHASELMLNPFGMSVVRRGELGDDKADVLFFRDYPKIIEFRAQLLQDRVVRSAYESIEQFPQWTPHLTLGFPETPAKKDIRDYPGITWVPFDRIAVWTGNFEGPEFFLQEDTSLDVMSMSFTEVGMEFLEHHGIRGMKWGVRRSQKALERERTRSDDSRRHATNAKKPLSDLSDKDLKDLHNRLNTERNVRNLQSQGKGFAKSLITNEAKQQIRQHAPKAVIAAGAAAVTFMLAKTIPISKMNLGI